MTAQQSLWTVLGPATVPTKRSGDRYVLARCACGETRNVYLRNIRNGQSMSCGCVRAAKAAEVNGRRRVDMTGQRLGIQTVIGHAGGGRWLVRCDCGDERTVATRGLRRAGARSCFRCRGVARKAA